MNEFYVRHKKLISIILCFVIVISITFNAPQKANAFVLTATATAIIVGLLYAAGVTYMTAEIANDAAELYYVRATNAERARIDAMVSQVTTNNTVTVDNVVWTDIVTYAQDNYDWMYNGLLTETVEEVGMTSEYQQWSGYPDTPTLTADYPYQVILQAGSWRGLIISKSPFYDYNSGWLRSSSSPIQYIQYDYNSATNQWINRFEALTSNNTGPIDKLQANYDIYTDSTLTTVYFAKTTLDPLPISTDYSIPYTGSVTLTMPNHDFKDSQGKREIGLPPGTITGNPDIEWYSDPATTANDVINPTVDTPVPATELNSTWWERMLNALVSPLVNYVSGILSKVSDIANAFSAEANADAQAANNYKNYNFPDLLLLLLLLLLAFLRLILRALVYIASLYSLVPDSSMFNETVIQGVDFVKNQNIPWFELTFYQLYVIVITFLYGIAVTQIGKRVLLSINAGKPISFVKKGGK